MSEGKHCEIERKYLVSPIAAAELSKRPGCEVWEIEQIYLTAVPGETRRVRRVTEGGETRWYRTFKRRISALSSAEDEGRIDEAAYLTYLKEADPALKPILKTRCRVPYAGQILEFDIYPFWRDRMILEIELEREDQPAIIPDWVHVFKEVTDDDRYKNVHLAAEVPMDDISAL